MSNPSNVPVSAGLIYWQNNIVGSCLLIVVSKAFIMLSLNYNRIPSIVIYHNTNN
jgi:hypothetical protein